MRVIFTKACVYNKLKRVVGNITTLNDKTAKEAIKLGVVKEYNGTFPPKAGRKHKTKINLKDLT